jgi:hypothetical protein
LPHDLLLDTGIDLAVYHTHFEDCKKEIRGPNTGHLTSDTLMKSRNYVYLKKIKIENGILKN